MPMNTNSESGVDSVDSNQNMSKKEHSAINNSTTSSGSSESNNKPRRLLTSFSIFRKDKKFSNSSSNNTESKKIVITTRNDTVAKSVPHNLVLDNSRLERRLQKELMAMIREPPPGVAVDSDGIGPNLSEWTIHLTGADNTEYAGEKFQLLFKFNDKYPFDSPEVTFVGTNIPIHPHVYSNGHICLSILTDDWSPALSVSSVCLSISSMLSSCREKKRPPDNTLYVKTCNKNPKKTKWWYHDDSV